MEDYKDQYLSIMQDYVDNYFNSEILIPKIDDLTNLIRNDYLADTQKMYLNDEILIGIDQEVKGSPGLKPFIVERRDNVILQLDSLASVMSLSNRRAQSTPDNFQLHPNYPNPFNPRTIINYELPITNYVDLSIYNLLGQKVVTLVNKKQNAGMYQIEWDASNFSSSVYYYRIEVRDPVRHTSDFQDVKKMILLR